VSTQSTRAEIFGVRPQREQDVSSRGGWDDTETNTSTARRPRRLQKLRTRVLKETYVHIDACSVSSAHTSPILANQAWESKQKGMYNDATKWRPKAVPNANSVVVLNGGTVESKSKE
jgi:hypothetical protein